MYDWNMIFDIDAEISLLYSKINGCAMNDIT